MAGKVITAEIAERMVSLYSDYMTGLGVNMEEQTQNVTFSTASLIDWLNGISGTSDEVMVSMAVYPEGHPRAGRITVIFSPVSAGARLLDGGDDGTGPFNEGTGSP